MLYLQGASEPDLRGAVLPLPLPIVSVARSPVAANLPGRRHYLAGPHATAGAAVLHPGGGAGDAPFPRGGCRYIVTRLPIVYT